MRTPRPYQRWAVNAIYNYYKSGQTGHPLVALPTGCHAKDSGILMYDGSVKKVQDVVVGDKLMGDDGTPRAVLRLARGREPMVKVSPIGFDSFVVNTSHLIKVSGSVVCIGEYLDKPTVGLHLHCYKNLIGFTCELLPEDDYYGFTLDGNKLYYDYQGFVHHNTGKEFCISLLITEILQKNPALRIVMLVDTKELVEQNAIGLQEMTPNLQVSVCCSGLRRNEIGALTYASIQSVAKRHAEFGHIDLVIIDEVQSCNTIDETMYNKFLTGLLEVNPKLRVVGFSATLWRTGMGMLTAEGSLFTDIVYDKTIGDEFLYFINEGFLVDIISKQPVTQLDVSNVRITKGEFNAKELQAAVDKNEVTYAALCEALPYMLLRNSIIVFGSGIQHCQHITDMLNDEFGVPATCVHSKLTDAERDTVIADFKAGRYKAIVNDNILTKGFNHRPIDLMIDLSPTASSSRHVQKIGRITRPMYAEGYDLNTQAGRLLAIAHSQKPNALLLDYSSNVYRNGEINNPKIPKRKGEGGDGTPPIKACPQCLALVPASRRICGTWDELKGVTCDFEFIFETKIQVTASAKSVIAKTTEPVRDWYDVRSVSYSAHKVKRNGNYALRVTYTAGMMTTFSEFVNIESAPYFANKWWSLRQTNRLPPMPATVAEALEVTNLLLVPKRIYVRTDTKYPEIESHDFGG